jgi:hypothetical protein
MQNDCKLDYSAVILYNLKYTAPWRIIMNDRCRRCNAVVAQDNPGELCSPCQKEKQRELREKLADKLYYEIDDMSEILGIGPEQVKRLARDWKIPGKIPGIRQHRFRRVVVDDWIEQGYIIAKMPTNPLQHEARLRCTKKDHDWLAEGRFDGVACSSEEAVTDISQYVIGVGYNRTCYFCEKTFFVPVP